MMRWLGIYCVGLLLLATALLGWAGWLMFAGFHSANVAVFTIAEETTLRNSDGCRCVSFSPDGKLIAVADIAGTVKLWDHAIGQPTFTVSVQKLLASSQVETRSMAFSPNGQLLALAASDTTVPLLDVMGKKVTRLLSGHESGATLVMFSPSGKFLATATEAGVVRIWDLESNTAKTVFDQKNSKYRGGYYPNIGGLAFDPDGDTLAIGVRGAVVFIDTPTGKERAAANGNWDLLHGLMYFAKGNKLAGCAGGQMIIWDAATGKVAFKLRAPQIESTNPVSFALSPDERFLALALSAGLDQNSFLQVWDLEQQEELGHFLSHHLCVFQVAWSLDGKTLATASFDKSVKLWDVAKIFKHFGK